MCIGMFDNERQMGISSPRTLLPGCLTAIQGYSGLFKVKISGPERAIEPQSSQAQSSPVKPRALGAPRTHSLAIYRSSGLNFESDGSLRSSRFGFCAFLCFFAAKDLGCSLKCRPGCPHPASCSALIASRRLRNYRRLARPIALACTKLQLIAPNCTLEGRRGRGISVGRAVAAAPS